MFTGTFDTSFGENMGDSALLQIFAGLSDPHHSASDNSCLSPPPMCVSMDMITMEDSGCSVMETPPGISAPMSGSLDTYVAARRLWWRYVSCRFKCCSAVVRVNCVTRTFLSLHASDDTCS